MYIDFGRRILIFAGQSLDKYRRNWDMDPRLQEPDYDRHYGDLAEIKNRWECCKYWNKIY